MANNFERERGRDYDRDFEREQRREPGSQRQDYREGGYNQHERERYSNTGGYYGQGGRGFEDFGGRRENYQGSSYGGSQNLGSGQGSYNAGGPQFENPNDWRSERGQWNRGQQNVGQENWGSHPGQGGGGFQTFNQGSRSMQGGFGEQYPAREEYNRPERYDYGMQRGSGAQSSYGQGGAHGSGTSSYSAIGPYSSEGNYNQSGFRGGFSNFGGGMGSYLGGADPSHSNLSGGGMSSGYGQSRQQGGRFSGKGPKGWKRSDERIREDINEHLTHHGDIDASEINVEVHNGEVTLTGTVNERQEKRLAEDLAESVSGVREVHNQIRVQRQQSETGGQSMAHAHGSTQEEKSSAAESSRKK